jgi:hypothetical protein
MCNSWEYFKGQCNICKKDTDVRHKNIWLIGSEGTDMCWSCEKDMINFLEQRKRYFLHEKLKKLKEKARRKKRGVMNAK